MTKTRYNAKIQRAKGLLELAAAIYETSLSFQTTRAAEQVLQTESRAGHELSLSLIAASREGSNSINLSFAADSFAELKGVAEGKYTLAWVNPSVAATLAYRGTGPFRKKLPLRVIATFPSYDVMGFAVHESTGITSLSQIRKERFPLRLSTNVTGKNALTASPTMFTVTAVMKAAGFTLADLRKWGGKIQSVSRPSHPDRRDAIQNGTVNAVFDEGIKSWGQTALDKGFVYLPIEGQVLKRFILNGLSHFRRAKVSFQRHAGRRSDCRFQRLADGGASRHAKRRRLRALRSHRETQASHSDGQLQAPRHRPVMRQRRRSALQHSVAPRRAPVLSRARLLKVRPIAFRW